MKFAKVFQQVLADENLPDEWVERAIQYKKLKKRINKVVDELESIGLNKFEHQFEYILEFQNNEIYPHLIAKITPILKTIILEKLDEMGYTYEISKIKDLANENKIQDINENDIDMNLNDISFDSRSVLSAPNPFDDSTLFYELKISLLEDSKFFQLLYNEIKDLHLLKHRLETEITDNVQTLANKISDTTIPKMKKNDLYVWREIFHYYIESEIFFSTHEQKSGEVDINLSKERYIIFLKKIQDLNLLEKFHQSNSMNSFKEFKTLNENVIKISNYQNFNNLAVKKILKKFDKQTQLNSKTLFPELINSNNLHLLDSSIINDICFIISNKLLSIVPQIDDYLCPICCSIAFKPIRLHCGHLFCIRCLVKLRRAHEDKCPLCRHQCLLQLTTGDLDVAQMNYMKLYFPKEVKEKEVLNDKEILKEQFGHSAETNCVVM